MLVRLNSARGPQVILKHPLVVVHQLQELLLEEFLAEDLAPNHDLPNPELHADLALQVLQELRMVLHVLPESSQGHPHEAVVLPHRELRLVSVLVVVEQDT